MTAVTLICGPLDERDCQLAYALIEAAGLDLSQEAWMREIRALGSGAAPVPAEAGGVVGCKAASGYLAGLFTYRIERATTGAAVLGIRRFLAFDLVAPTSAEALLLEAERLALAQECDAIELSLAPIGQASALAGRDTVAQVVSLTKRAAGAVRAPGAALEAAGYEIAGLTFRKFLSPAPAARS